MTHGNRLVPLADALSDHSSEGIAILTAEPWRVLHALVYTMIALVLTALAWSFIGRADVIVTAQGTLSSARSTLDNTTNLTEPNSVQLQQLGSIARSLQARGEEQVTAGGHEVADKGQVFGAIDVVKNEQPSAIRFQPAAHGGDNHAQVLFVLLRKVQQARQCGEGIGSAPEHG